MWHYLYLFIDFTSLVLPLAFSFHPRFNFAKKWRQLFPAILAGAIPFLCWDVWFTHMKIWAFNSTYVSGVYFFNLPIEEVLFFFCIPYACVFTYETVNFLLKKKPGEQATNFITDGLIFGLLLFGVFNLTKWYTATTFIATAVLLIYLRRIAKASYLNKFYFSFIFILIPFFIVNGILTGTAIERPVVVYNDEENLGLRLGTIPLEDVFYGMLLLLINVSIFEWLKQKRAPIPTEA